MNDFIQNLQPRLFWDIDLNGLDAEKHADWIIMRVFDRGTLEDIWTLHRYYGREKVSQVLQQAPSLKRADLYLATLIYQLKPADFLCYRQNQFRPGF